MFVEADGAVAELDDLRLEGLELLLDGFVLTDGLFVEGAELRLVDQLVELRLEGGSRLRALVVGRAALLAELLSDGGALLVLAEILQRQRRAEDAVAVRSRVGDPHQEVDLELEARVYSAGLGASSPVHRLSMSLGSMVRDGTKDPPDVRGPREAAGRK